MPSLAASRDQVALARSPGLHWIRSADSQALITVATAPDELAPDETLRSRFRDGRFLPLLAWWLFLRDATGEAQWQLPPPRAAFLFDDPNLHTARYGMLDYDLASSHAHEHGYHLAIATVPIDTWFNSRRAVQAFANSRGRLSILIHGNDHLRHELGRLSSIDAGIAVAAQAQRRINAMEKRTGLVVDRVMAAPHGRCSLEAAIGLARTGYEALCNSRPLPWIDSGSEVAAELGWEPAETISEGLSVLIRHRLSARPGDLLLGAALGQPMVLYGHHDDLSGGLGLLPQLARNVDPRRQARWMSLGAISRTSCSTKVVDSTLNVRPHARTVEVEVPADVTTLRIEGMFADQATSVDAYTQNRPLPPAGRHQFMVTGSTRVLVNLRFPNIVDSAAVPAPSQPLWRRFRRPLAEARDRTLALRVRAHAQFGTRP
jgi:hypothetical protein